MVNGVLEVAHKAINHVYLPISTFVPILSQLLFGGSFFFLAPLLLVESIFDLTFMRMYHLVPGKVNSI